MNNDPPFRLPALGCGLLFDGVDDLVKVPDSDSLDLAGDELTIAVWVQPHTAQAGPLVRKINRTHGYRVNIIGTRAIRFVLRQNGQNKTVTTTTTLPLHKWTHVAARYDGAQIRIFINGTLDTATTAATGSLFPTTEPVWIGAHTNNYRFHGYLDDISIYNRALSDSEITDLVNDVDKRYEYHHVNALGSNIVLTDDNQNVLARYEYDVFGAIRAETGTSDNTRKFTGKEFDADSNLYYYAARYYDPYIGRFTQRDPIGDGVNWYAYARNNPLRFIDPDGLRALSPLETEALNLIFKGTINGDQFEITMDPTLEKGKRASFRGLNEEGKFDVRIHPKFYAGLDGNSSLDNTDVLDPDVVDALGIFIHEATHAWQRTYKAFLGRSPLRPIPPGGGGFYGFNTFELTTLQLGKEQHASAVQSYFHIFWQLKRGATIIDLSMDFRYHDLPQQMYWDEAPTMLQHFGPLLNNLHDPIKELPLGAIKAGIE